MTTGTRGSDQAENGFLAQEIEETAPLRRDIADGEPMASVS